MKNKKKLLTIASGLLLTGTLLSACGSSEKEAGSDASKDKVTIDIFNYKVEMKDQFESLVEKYEESNGDVSINVKTVGGGTNWESTLKTSFASGDEPDIFPVGGPSQVAEYHDSLADVSDTKAAELALEGTLKSVVEDEKVLGLPFNLEGFGILYNKAVFKKAGIDVRSIVTYQDFENAVKELDSNKDELEIKAVFALPAKEKWVIGNHIGNAFLSPEFDSNIVNAYNAETVEFEKADEFKRFLDLNYKYSIQPALSLDYSQQVEEYFSLQQVAMITQGNWVYPTIYQMDAEFAETNLGILPIPLDGYEGKIPVDVPMYWAVNNNSDAKEIQAAKDFLDWMYTSEEGKQIILEELKFIPAYEGYDADKIADPISRDLYKYSTEGNNIGWIYRGSPQGWHEESLAVNIQKYFSGEMTWDEVISKSKQDWEKARK